MLKTEQRSNHHRLPHIALPRPHTEMDTAIAVGAGFVLGCVYCRQGWQFEVPFVLAWRQWTGPPALRGTAPQSFTTTTRRTVMPQE